MTKLNTNIRNRIVFKKTVKFISGVTIDKDGDKFPVYKRTPIVTSCIRLYDGAFAILTTLSRCAFNLILFCAEEMDEHGLVRNNTDTRQLFIKVIGEYSKGECIYAETSVTMAFSELTRVGLLLPKSRGLFRINPMYVWRNSPLNRIRIIKGELEEMNEKTFNRIIKPIKGLEDHDREKD